MDGLSCMSSSFNRDGNILPAGRFSFLFLLSPLLSGWQEDLCSVVYLLLHLWHCGIPSTATHRDSWSSVGMLQVGRTQKGEDLWKLENPLLQISCKTEMSGHPHGISAVGLSPEIFLAVPIIIVKSLFWREFWQTLNARCSLEFVFEAWLCPELSLWG